MHRDCRSAFEAAAAVAHLEGNYAAGQDLFPTAPSGNVRGTGPGVAEIEFELLPAHRPAESIAIFAADKCGPGAYNMALYYAFADPARSSGFLLSPEVRKGFTFVIEDMDHRVEAGAEPAHRQVRLVSPEDNIEILALLRDIDRYAVAEIRSRAHPDETTVAVSTDRLHNITGTYQGKDDPVMVVRNQRIFPALEEVIDPFRLVPLVTGDTRGSHTLPLMPVAIDTAVGGAYCLPIVSCLACSVSAEGMFSANMLDVFANVAWDRYRALAQERADWMRSQAPFGVAMASQRRSPTPGSRACRRAQRPLRAHRRKDRRMISWESESQRDPKAPLLARRGVGVRQLPRLRPHLPTPRSPPIPRSSPT